MVALYHKGYDSIAKDFQDLEIKVFLILNFSKLCTFGCIFLCKLVLLTRSFTSQCLLFT